MGRPLPKTTTQHLQAFGWLPEGNSLPLQLLRQTGTNSFLAQDPTGLTGTVTLATAVNNPGDVLVLAYDEYGGSYAVTHATDTLLTLVAINADIFPDGAQIHYNLTGVPEPDAVWIDNSHDYNQTVLAAPPSQDQGYATAVSDTGESFVVQEYQQAWLVDLQGNYTQLNPAAGATSPELYAYYMNTDGSITAGYSYDAGGYNTPTLWDTTGTATLLPHPGGTQYDLYTVGFSADASTLVAVSGNYYIIVYTNGAISDNIAPPSWVPSNQFEYESTWCSVDCQSIWAGILHNGTTTLGVWSAGSWTQITSYPYTNSPVTNGWSDGTGQRTIIEVNGGDYYLQTADGGATWTTWTQPFPNAVPAFMSTDATIVGRAEDDYNYFPWVGGWDNTAQRLPGIAGNGDGYLGEVNAISRTGVWLAGDGDDQNENDLPIIWNLN